MSVKADEFTINDEEYNIDDEEATKSDQNLTQKNIEKLLEPSRHDFELNENLLSVNVF
jgi:hypothetical protein